MNLENIILPGGYFEYSPTGIHCPFQRYLAELLGEKQKLGPFMQILSICSRLLNQEIMRATALLSNQFVDQERMEQESPHRSVSQHINGGQINMGAWSAMQTEENRLLQKMAPFQPSPLDWHVVPGTATTPVVKRVI